MPFITDEELQDFKDQIEKAEEAKRTSNYMREKAIKDEQENSQKFKIATIILGIVALLGVAGTIYFMNFSTPSNMISQKEHNDQKGILENKIAGLEETIQNLSMNQELNADDSGESAGSLNDELVYAVQIGAFEEKNLSMYSENFVNFKEIRSEGFNKYALGNFETLNEAKKFRRELVKLGFRNAFIASYQNGKRLKIEEAW
ncbi:SPOR domain-containing protein [Aquimarina gracilis]|uniref:SPOR domain-containing protein n=1 Tax=Aquimarina gracilis TaxID=874422 RepID=A0ABU5ZU34_9FLAO|nr:SPOR domain-containing protein [Aquimarina gracilis]MEB3345503.1 SPOR domain-containing protein [Aquimarina gracilis]